jgi:addiction module HigA family antidote
MIKNPKPMHPGQVLAEIYMKEMSLNQSQLADKCKCSPRKINEIVNAKRSVSPEFALGVRKNSRDYCRNVGSDAG